MHKSKFLPLFLLFVLIFGFAIGYSIRNQNSPIVSKPIKVFLTPTVTPDASYLLSWKDKSNLLLKKFMDYQLERNPTKVMSLFTPPSSPNEQSQYYFIMGMDLPESLPRLYATAGFGYKLSSWKIVSSKISDQQSSYEIEEKRSLWDNTSGQWILGSTKNTIVNITSVGINPMIRNYYTKGVSVDKYSGFD